MTNTEVVGQIVTMTTDLFAFMMPVIGVLAGIVFVTSFMLSVTLGLGKRTFGA